MRHLATAAVLGACTIVAPPLRSADFGLCGPGAVLPPRPEVEVMPEAPGVASIEADDADLSDTEVSVLRGDVQVVRDDAQLSADEVRYDRRREAIDASGSMRFWGRGVFLSGDRGRMQMRDDSTLVENARFAVEEAHARGSADEVRLSGSDVLKARDARYTTCNPDDEAWVLEAERIKLDKSADRGSARNVWLHFKGVPLFYSPYLSFPLSDARTSGFLAPSFGVSGSTGVEATVPYYFNIAPNMDATLALRGMTDRGVQLQGEYRYLFPWGRGALGVEALPDDDQRGEGRLGLNFLHHSDPDGPWSTDLRFDWVSDQEYFEDLGTELAISSRSFLEQRGDLIYDTPALWARARVQGYQTLDRTLDANDEPYDRLPQLLAQTRFAERNRRLGFNARAEVAHFYRRDSVTGVRWDLEPHVVLPYRTASGFLVGKTSLRYTGYALDGTGPSRSDDPSRILPVFSVDGGLYFDRQLSFAGKQLRQTLEPRLFYLFVPFDDQSELPVFDTGEYTFSFAQLFREDRFSGADRVGDANQVTLAVTSRLLNPRSGSELLRASVGQIRYFRDRKVTLPDGRRETGAGSDLVGEISANLDKRWRLTAGMQWNTSRSQTERNTVAVRFQPGQRRVVNAAYRFVRETVEQTDLSFAWPLSRDWRAVGRWNYSLDGKRTLEVFGGLEYESCCWGLRVVARRYLSSTDGEYNNAVFVQLVLKGLAGVGGAEAFLTQSIPGYRNEF